MTPEYLSISQVAELLGVHYATIKREIDERNIGHTRIRGRIMIPKGCLEAYLKRNYRRARPRRPF